MKNRELHQWLPWKWFRASPIGASKAQRPVEEKQDRSLCGNSWWRETWGMKCLAYSLESTCGRVKNIKPHSPLTGPGWLTLQPSRASWWTRASLSCPVLAKLGPQCCSVLGSGFLEAVFFRSTICFTSRMPFLCFCGTSTCLSRILDFGRYHIVSEEHKQNLRRNRVQSLKWLVGFFLQLFGYYSNDGYNGEAVRTGTGGIWVFPAFSFLFCYDSKSSLKIRFINFLKNVFRWGGEYSLLGHTAPQHQQVKLKPIGKQGKKFKKECL